jgi:DNA modification methylase
LVWDKVVDGKAGGYRYFARQAEAILYVNVGNRTLSPITLEGDDKQTNKYSSLLRYRAESKAGENEFWKPLGVLEHLIKLATGEDDNEAANRQVILDPFCGSGSTGVAAINCNRDFRLIESHEGQFKKAKGNILLAAGDKAVSK